MSGRSGSTGSILTMLTMVTMRDVTVEAVDEGIYVYASDNVVLHDVVVDGAATRESVAGNGRRSP